MLVRFKMWQPNLERKQDALPPWLHNYALVVSLSKYKSATLPDNQKTILCSISATAQSSFLQGNMNLAHRTWPGSTSG